MNLYKEIATLSPEKRELLEAMLAEQGVDLSEVVIVPVPRDGRRLPLSFAQQRLWFLDRLQPESPLYNIPAALRLRGRLDLEALEKSFELIVRRHEILRTVFDEENGEPYQVISDQVRLPIEVVDLREIPDEQIESELLRLAVEDSLRPFNLRKGPLLRVHLLRFREDDHGLLVTMHHIVSDNWSTGLFVKEFMSAYTAFAAGREPELPELVVQYADYAAWQRKWLRGKTLEKQLSYWKEKLAGIPPVIDLPLDKPRPGFQTYNGSFELFEIPADLAAQLRELSRRQDVTLFMTLLAAFFALLHRYSGQDDICVGSPIANRNRKETENLIGFFVNTLVLRANLSGNPKFTELLQQVKETTLGAYAHQDLPFEMLVEELHPERDMSHSPLFQVMFVMNNAPVSRLELPGLEISVLDVDNGTAKFDLILNVTELGEGPLQCKLEYNTDLFVRDTVRRLLSHYLTVLGQVAAEPERRVGEIELLTPEERQRVLGDWSRSDADVTAPGTVVDLFREQAQRSPDHVALRLDGEPDLSYGELDRLSSKLAVYLQGRGLKAGQTVALGLRRTSRSVVALLAVLKAGGVAVPLDPNYPAERLQFMISDSGAKYLLLDDPGSKLGVAEGVGERIALAEVWEDVLAQDETRLQAALDRDAPAYVIYTSGSTGRPKGVVVQHGPFADHLLDMSRHYELSAEDVVLEFAALNFDAGLEQLFTPLISGATVCMRGDDIWDARQFAAKLAEWRLTVINPPTSYFAHVLQEWTRQPEALPENRVRLVIVGGDVFRNETARLLQKTALAGARVLNAYGPTETVITATTHPVRGEPTGPSVPIGRPRANRRVFVVDRYGNLTPPGVPGELLIGGTNLAQGYLGQPELTRERFVTRRFGDETLRVYKTGDRVRFLNDGSLEFLGRVDFQVKIRGFRVELGEIEAAMEAVPAVARAAVKVFERENADKMLVGYYQTTGEADLDENALRRELKKSLPDYMVPSLFVRVEKMPLTPGGKVDRQALPVPDLSRLCASTEYVAPRTPTEEKLAEIVRDVLGVERVGVYDNFFELGGHSMMATQVVSRIREEFGVEIPLRTLFEHPTVEEITQEIAVLQAESVGDEELEALLAELDDLSDEEARELLAQDAAGEPGNGGTAGPDESEGSNGKPRNALEAFLLDLWKDALGVDELGIDDDFFAKGGDEEKAARLVERLEREFQEQAPPGALLQAPTVAKFATFMSEYYPDLVARKFGEVATGEDCATDRWKAVAAGPDVTEEHVARIRQIIVPYRMDPGFTRRRNRQAVFVLSPPRSGSTLLRVMLAGNRRLFAPPEMDLLSFNTLRERKEFYQSAGLWMWLEVVPQVLMEVYDCDLEEAKKIEEAYLLQNLSTHDFYHRLQEEIGDRLLVDKTPSYSIDRNILERAEETFDRPLYIHLTRHPYATIYSFVEARLDEHFFKFKHPFTRRQLAELVWLVSHQNILAFLADVPDSRQLRVRYEDLVQEPEREMRRIADFLGVPFEEGMIKPYEGDGRMTRGLNRAGQMVGDFKFYLHRGIDASSATRWKKFHCRDFLSPFARSVAADLGYEDV